MFANPYAVIDLETTGFGQNDRIVEVGVVLLDGDAQFERTWETLVQPNRDIPNSFVHGITASDVVSAPTFEEIAGELQRVLEGRTIVAHNLSFENRFLAQEFNRVGVELPPLGPFSIDTLQLSQKLLDGSPKSLAEALAKAGLVNSRPHSALSDASATADLLGYLLPQAANLAVNHRVLHFTSLLESPGCSLRTRNQEVPSPGEWVERLAQQLPSSGQTDVDSYRYLLAQSLLDRSVSASEANLLILEAEKLRLTKDDVVMIHREFLGQLAVEAWMDGIITDEERSTLHSVAKHLAVENEYVDHLLSEPVEGEGSIQFALEVGQRVSFTGVLTLPRDQWEAKARAAGLEVGGVCAKSVVLVCEDPNSRSGKAKRARELSVPVVDEKTFARLLNKLVSEGPAIGNGADFEVLPSLYEEENALISAFPWIGEAETQILSIESAANNWIDCHFDEPIHMVSPRLSLNASLDLFDEPQGVFLRWKQQHAVPLLATARDISDIRGVGKRKLFQVVKEVLTLALDMQPGADEFTPPFGQECEPAAVPDSENRLVSDLNFLIGIHKLSGIAWIGDWAAEPGIEAIQTEISTHLPDPEEEVFSRFTDELRTVLREDERFADVLVRRIVGGETLEELGQRFGVTRERARQLESQLLAKLETMVPTGFILGEVMKSRFYPLAAKSTMAEQCPRLSRPIPEIGLTVGQMLTGVFAKWELGDGFVFEPGYDEKISAAFESGANDSGVAKLPDIAEMLGVPVENLVARISAGHDFRYLVLGDEVLTKTNSIQDRAAGALSILGQPKSLDQILEFLGAGNKRSAGNALSIDPRFTRISSEKWALKAWGFEEFKSIASWIGQEVDKNGSVPLSELLKNAERLDISESSIRAYASSGEFIVSEGLVTRGTGQVEVDTPIEEGKNLFLRDGAWNLLVTINYDHLRGSGFSVPRALIGYYSVPFLGETILHSPLGPQALRFNRNNVAQISTIKRFLDQLGSKEGDRVWLKFGEDRTFDVQPAPNFVPDSHGWDSILSACGIVVDEKATDAEKEAALIEGLGLEAGVARRRVVSRLRHRGQDDLADELQKL